MNLYEVIFDWAEGRDDDADTIYLVRAHSFQNAIEVACNSLSLPHHVGQPPPLLPDLVFEIGKDLSIGSSDEPILLRGPYVQCAYNYCWKGWERKVKDGVKTNEWQEK